MFTQLAFVVIYIFQITVSDLEQPGGGLIIYIFKPYNAPADLFKLHMLERYSRGCVCTCCTIHFVPLLGDCVSSTKRLDGDVQLFSSAGC